MLVRTGRSATSTSATLCGPAANGERADPGFVARKYRANPQHPRRSGLRARSPIAVGRRRDDQGTARAAGLVHQVNVTADRRERRSRSRRRRTVTGVVTQVSVRPGLPRADRLAATGCHGRRSRTFVSVAQHPAPHAKVDRGGTLSCRFSTQCTTASRASSGGGRRARRHRRERPSNTNTIGYKEFARGLRERPRRARSARRTARPASGVRLARKTQQIFAQGALVNTGNDTDVALSGDGFFVVNGTVDGVPGQLLHAGGSRPRSINNQGTLVNPDGLALQGYEHRTATAPSTRRSARSSSRPRSSRRRQRRRSRSPRTSTRPTTPPTPPWDPQNPGGDLEPLDDRCAGLRLARQARTPSTSISARAAPGTWDAQRRSRRAMTSPAAPPAKNVEIGDRHAVCSTPHGALQSSTSHGPTGGTGRASNGAAANQAHQARFRHADRRRAAPVLGGTTQFGSTDAISAQSQDGYASGDLAGVKIDSNGIVSGVYSNGQTVAAGQFAIAKFRSNDGLAKNGENVWSATQRLWAKRPSAPPAAAVAARSSPARSKHRTSTSPSNSLT